MNKNDIKYMFLCIFLMILIIFLIYSSFGLLFSDFSGGFVVLVTCKNKDKINEMLEKEGIEDQNITRLELDKILGDAELRAYNYFKLCNTERVGQNSELMDYMCEEGFSKKYKYMSYVLALIILIVINKELIDKENEKFEAIRQEKMKE